MANFVVIVDPDAERRSLFGETVKPKLQLVAGLKTSSCSSGDFFAAWAAAGNAPIDHVADDEGATIVWGRALRAGSLEEAPASVLRKAWCVGLEQTPEVFDGFYAAAVYRQDGGLTVGTDPLGLFPVYYYDSGDVLLVGTSPELFRFHPSFRARFNPIGLAAILLTMHSIDGETMLSGVRRLKAGYYLYRDRRIQTKEIRHYSIPVSRRHFDLPFSSQVQALDQALRKSVARHAAKNELHILLLSGGLDSRILGGYLRDSGVETVALCLGQPGDSEVKCAVRVASCLGFDHEVREVDEEQYSRFAELQAQWEHGTTGFSTIMEWGIHPLFKASSHYMVGGHVMDTIIGPYLEHQHFSGPPSFQQFFAFINSHGVQVEKVRKLLRKESFGNALDDSIDRIRQIYEGYSDLESQRAWAFKINHRARFHVGGVLWRHSFGAWPVLPATDRSVLECAGGMPAATLAERRAEKDILCTRFPALAEIPLDRSDSEPLRPRLRWLLKRQIQWKLGRWGGFIFNGHYRNRHRISYLYDINGAGWTRVREAAEPFRKMAYQFFERDALDELLPPPNVPVPYKHGIIDVSGIKSVIGFLLWLKDHPC
ncbi:MAG: asparagine synthase-related protein [Candidatus Binatia bacterium]